MQAQVDIINCKVKCPRICMWQLQNPKNNIYSTCIIFLHFLCVLVALCNWQFDVILEQSCVVKLYSQTMGTIAPINQTILAKRKSRINPTTSTILNIKVNMLLSHWIVFSTQDSFVFFISAQRDSLFISIVYCLWALLISPSAALSPMTLCYSLYSYSHSLLNQSSSEISD